MALKTVKRVTFSLPKATLIKLEMRVPKNRRSKFVAQSIENSLPGPKEKTFEEVCRFWDDLANSVKRKNKKTAVEMQREDRLSH